MAPPPDVPEAALVADASFWINLEATGRARRVLGLLARPVVVDVALAELVRGRFKGRRTAAEVATLIAAGLVEVAALPADDGEAFIGLVSGTGSLDDGEAATLLVASRRGATAVVDERRATDVSARTFPALALRSTVDLLLAPATRRGLGEHVLAEALAGALALARMRVPPDRVAEVVAVVGRERALLHAGLRRALLAGGVDPIERSRDGAGA